jgi:sugar phosphate isomerase/epimerase
MRRNGVGLELVQYDTNWVCNYPADKVAELADLLRKEKIDLTVHGPIHDLNPGSLDDVVRDYTRHCFFKTLALCHALGARALVLHLGVNPLLPASALDGWLATSIRTWEPIVDMAEQLGLTIRLENMYVQDPRFLVSLKKSLKSDAIKFCFDIGHFNVYSKTPLKLWLDEMGDSIDEVHLADNDGFDDVHAALGKGNVDFESLFAELSARGVDPQFTIEMTSDKFPRSLNYLAKNEFLKPFEKG